MLFLLELMLALSLFSVIVTGFFKLLNVYEMRRDIYAQEERIKRIELAFVKTFSLIVDHIRANCSDGITTASCTNTYPFPSSLANSGRTLHITYPINVSLPSRGSLIASMRSLWEDADCSFSDAAGIVNVNCADVNVAGTYTAPTLVDPATAPLINLEYLKLGLDGNILRKPFSVSFADEYIYRQRANEGFFISLSNILKEYHLQHRVDEANNPCTAGGGLHSFDDIKIPWIMKGYTANFDQLCNTSTATTCSCSNITWNTVNQTNRTSMVTLLRNLFGGSLPYNLVDYFGNPINIYAIVNSSDTPVTYPNPQPNYPQSPPYTGLIRLDTTFTCTASKLPYCYLKFVYPN